MSQPQTTNLENKNNHYQITNKTKFKRSREKGKYFYPTRFQYYNPFLGFQPHWNYYNWKRPPLVRRPPLLKTPEKQRPKSPSPGTEEYNLKKIQETSDMIKKQLLMPPETSKENNVNLEKYKQSVESDKNSEMNYKRNHKSDDEKPVKPTKKSVQYDVEEIHKKIMTHITKLNHGKKMNLICATSSGYDEAIQQIQKQKRLELSKVLRDMCSNQTNSESSEVINSIIPDFGIKIENLPLEVIQELSSTLDCNFEDTSLLNCDDQTVKIKTEVCDENELVPNYSILTKIKVEKDAYDEVDNIGECSMDTAENMEFSSNTSSIHNDTFNQVIEYHNRIKTNSRHTQTGRIMKNSNAAQTDFNIIKPFEIKSDPENLNKAIETMLDIDREIARLTELRQSIFLKLQSNNYENNTKVKKQNAKTKTKNHTVKEALKNTKSIKQTKSTKEAEKDLYKQELHFCLDSEKILVIKVYKNILVAGSESGKVYYINITTGQTMHTFNLGEFPITDFCLTNALKKNSHIYISSFDDKIRECEFISQRPLRIIKTIEGVQCMEMAWGFIFIGTVGGNLQRYSLKKFKIEFEERISENRILVLKASLEGARRVLLVGTKNYPVCIRDAMSGLHMRTMNDIITPTVYSLLLENSLVYCGTTFHDILVYRFHDGTLIRKYQASNSKGVGCMKIVENLLFASCYDGNIYVYNTKNNQYVGVIQGPGGLILSMEILKNLIIVGTMCFNFKSLLIPDYILESNKL